MNTARLTQWNWKLLSFLLPSVIGGGLFWSFIREVLLGHVVFNNVPLVNLALFFILGLILLAVWIGPLLLIPYVASWRGIHWSVVGLSSLTVLFSFPSQLWTWVALLLLVICVGWGIETIGQDIRNRLSVQPMLSIPHGITFVIFAIILSVSLLYYQQLRGTHESTEQLSNQFIDQTVTLTERTLPTFYKGYRSEMTIDELIGQQIPTADSILKDINFDTFTNASDQQKALEQKLTDLGIDPGSSTVNVQDGEAQVRAQIDQKLQEFHQQTVDQAREELSKRFDIPLQGTDTVHQALMSIIGKQFNTYVKRWVTFVPALLALALFFVLRFFTSLLQAVVVWFSWLYLRILRSLKVIRITQQTVPAEKVEWGV